MALTQGAWTQVSGVGNSNTRVWTCNVAFTTAEHDAYTNPTPVTLDPHKPWTLLIKCAATPDGSALPVDLWAGYGEFELDGDDSTVAALSGTVGFKIKQVLDDCVLAVSPLIYAITFDPELPVSDVVTVAAIATGLKVRIPVVPRYVINLNGASTLNATNCDFYIIQTD